MPASADDHVLARAFDWIKARVARDNELASMSRADMQALAADMGVSESDFRDIAPRLTDHSEQMDAMMRLRGLDPDAVRRGFGQLLRDLELTCARCPNPGLCRRELEAGTAAAHQRDFCPNAEAMNILPGARA